MIKMSQLNVLYEGSRLSTTAEAEVTDGGVGAHKLKDHREESSQGKSFELTFITVMGVTRDFSILDY